MAGIQLKSEIALVSDDRNLLESHETRITQNANAISLLATESQINEITGEIDLIQAELLIQSSEISSKVSQTDYNGNEIATLINQTATTVAITGPKIDLRGLVTVNSKFKVLLDGTIEAVDGKFSGTIESANIISTTITGGTINGSNINTSEDISVGQSVSLPISLPTTGTELLQWSTWGGKGLRFGNAVSGVYPAFISVVNMKTIAGLPSDLIRMRIKASERLIITSDQLFLEFGGNSYEVSRRSSDGALILS